jgi:hypothetical protein
MVARCTGSKAKTLGMYHPQPPNVGVGSESTYVASLVHYGKDELFVQQGPFLMERPLLIFRRGHYNQILWADFVLT